MRRTWRYGLSVFLGEWAPKLPSLMNPSKSVHPAQAVSYFSSLVSTKGNIWNQVQDHVQNAEHPLNLLVSIVLDILMRTVHYWHKTWIFSMALMTNNGASFRCKSAFFCQVLSPQEFFLWHCGTVPALCVSDLKVCNVPSFGVWCAYFLTLRSFKRTSCLCHYYHNSRHYAEYKVLAERGKDGLFQLPRFGLNFSTHTFSSRVRGSGVPGYLKTSRLPSCPWCPPRAIGRSLSRVPFNDAMHSKLIASYFLSYFPFQGKSWLTNTTAWIPWADTG